MRKASLSPNPFTAAKQRFIVEGLPEADRIVTRDEISLEYGVIERPDATRVPKGRVAPGDFGVTLDFADDLARNAYMSWYHQCRDRGGTTGQVDIADGPVVGIDPNYKKTVYIIYHRLYITPGGVEQPAKLELLGCFPTNISFPEYDMDSEDSSMLSLTISYDDGRLLDTAGTSQSSQSVGGVTTV